MSVLDPHHIVPIKPQLGSWQPSDQGLKAWTGDPINGFSNSTALPTAGLLNVMRLRISGPTTITNILVYVGTGGTTLTSGQCFAALYRASAGTLIAQTADQATAWASSGLKTMALSGGPYTVTSDVYAALWFNGTAGPQIARSTNLNAPFVNANMTSSFRIASADTGVTTTAPSTLGTQTAVGTGWWVALS